MELAGVVEEGSAVTEFEVGDEVFGLPHSGANAQYVAREHGALAHKPSLSFEEAAALSDGARWGVPRQGGAPDQGSASSCTGPPERSGRRPVAKATGAHVTAVGNTKNVELVRSLGAVVLDYTREDFTKNGETLRRRLRRRRQALVRAPGALAQARRRIHRDRPRVHVARPFVALATVIGSSGLRSDIPVHEGGRAHVDLVASNRPRTTGWSTRGDTLRRDGPEDRQRGVVGGAGGVGGPRPLRAAGSAAGRRGRSPEPADDAVLVRVHATMVTRTDIPTCALRSRSSGTHVEEAPST